MTDSCDTGRQIEGPLRAVPPAWDGDEAYRVVVETVPRGIVELDAAGVIRSCNPAYCRMFGYSNGELLGKGVWELHEPGEAREALQAYLTRLAARQPPPTPLFTQKRTKDGRTIDVRVDWDYKRDAAGDLVGFVAIVTDITEQRETEQALRRAHEELELRVRERTADLARTVAKLQAEIRERHHMEQALRQQSRHLDAFFEHSLTPIAFLDPRFNFIRVNAAYAQADTRGVEDFPGRNHFELYPSEENRAIFEEVVRTKTPYQASARPFVYPDHPEWGVTYWDWSLVPLLDERGEVELLVLAMRDVTERKRAELELQALNQSLRQQAAQLRRLTANSPAGQREGLEPIDGHGAVASAPSKGTRGQAVPRPRASAPIPPGNTRSRVLLVDDHKIFRQGLASLLSDEDDIEIVGEAADGQEAVELARQLQPDVILMDITMPRLDGIGATRQIKRELPEVLIIGLSMHDDDLGAAICAAGALLYVSKHGPSERLLEAIRRGV